MSPLSDSGYCAEEVAELCKRWERGGERREEGRGGEGEKEEGSGGRGKGTYTKVHKECQAIRLLNLSHIYKNSS